MKTKFKIFIIAIFAMFAVSANAQNDFRFNGKITPVFGVGGENSDVSSTLNYGVQLSLGGTNETSFIGIGVGLEGFTEHYSYNGSVENFTGFNVPLFAQYSYSAPNSGYTFDAKAGPSFYTYDNFTKTGFYLNVTPLGWNLDNHNSVGIGYRYMRLYDVNCHSAQFSYTYTF